MTTNSSKSQMFVCLRCQRGFVLTSTYCDLLKRRDAKMVVPVLCPTCFLTKKPLRKQRGQVKWFNPRKRYGFIATEAGDEIFFHQDQLLADNHQVPGRGQTVRFHLHYPPRGPEALNVELVEG